MPFPHHFIPKSHIQLSIKLCLSNISLLFSKIFLMWTIFKVFIEFVTLLLLFYVLVFWPWGMRDPSSPTRDRTCTPCTGRWSLNHWTARKSPILHFSVHLYYYCPRSGFHHLSPGPGPLCTPARMTHLEYNYYHPFSLNNFPKPTGYSPSHITTVIRHSLTFIIHSSNTKLLLIPVWPCYFLSSSAHANPSLKFTFSFQMFYLPWTSIIPSDKVRYP